MSRLRAAPRAVWLWVRGSRLLWWAVGLASLEAALGFTLSIAGGPRGLLTPGGTLDPGVAIVGACYLASRVAVRFGLPALAGAALGRGLARLGSSR